jgi:hypothetical protein
MLFGETVAVYCETHKTTMDTVCGKNVGFLTMKRVVHTERLKMVNEQSCVNHAHAWADPRAIAMAHCKSSAHIRTQHVGR